MEKPYTMQTVLLTVGASALLLPAAEGCATTRELRGRPIPQHRVDQIVKGKTTMTGIITMFGSPTENAEVNGTWLYTYKHTKITRRSTFFPYWTDTQDIEKSDVLTITFDDNNVVESFYVERGL